MPCSAAKLATTIPVPAADLYVGPFHRLCRRAAHAIAGSADTVLVLSAAHGLDDALWGYDWTAAPGQDLAQLFAAGTGISSSYATSGVNSRTRPKQSGPAPVATASAPEARTCTTPTRRT
ncbi:hypothetical protein GCM10010271_55200 [Streptomyces kurssanovii]|nr:hypothetical protein GCM10010271_55200 [Streptomyces kurssanovii]